MNDKAIDTSQRDYYKQVITSILQGLNEILDAQIVKKQLENIKGLKLDENAQVLTIQGDPQKITLEVMDQFISLSNEVVAKTFQPLLKKYPWIKIPKLE